MIVVTGASGLLGAAVASHAVEAGHEVVGLCHSHPVVIPGAKIISVDLADSNSLHEKITALHPRAIIHCAAATNVDWCEDHPAETEKVNLTATARLAEVAAGLGAGFLYVSTDAVFDGRRGNYKETDDPAPLNVYARTKLAAEQAAVELLPSTIVTRVNIYGWNIQNKHSLAEWMLAKLDAGERLPGFTDVVFSPTLVNDLAEILLAMLDRRLSGIYHVVGSEAISKFEFARRLATVFGHDPERVTPIRCADARLKAERPLNVSLSVSKVETALDRKLPGVDAGLDRFRSFADEGYRQRLKTYLGR